MTNTWMVRAGRGGYVIEDFEKKGCVAVGWAEMGDISRIKTREDLGRCHDEDLYAMIWKTTEQADRSDPPPFKVLRDLCPETPANVTWNRRSCFGTLPNVQIFRI